MPKPGYKQTELGEIPEGWEDMDRFVKAVQCFIMNEKFLLENNLNERTITHKLAEYLQKEYCEYEVDCEYNRMPNGESYDEGVAKKILNMGGKSFEECTKRSDTSDFTAFPDIIIHHRGDNENNFLVVEVKKKNNNSKNWCDFKKLEAFTKQLNYKYGIYLEFDNEGISDMRFFENGNAIGGAVDE